MDRNQGSGQAEETQNVLQIIVIEVKRSRRFSQPTQMCSPFLYYLLLTDSGEIECYDEVIQVKYPKQWKYVIDDMMQPLILNQAWDLSRLPNEKKALHNKWVYKLKEEPNDIKYYKVRFIVKGFHYKEGIKYRKSSPQ